MDDNKPHGHHIEFMSSGEENTHHKTGISSKASMQQRSQKEERASDEDSNDYGLWTFIKINTVELSWE